MRVEVDDADARRPFGHGKVRGKPRERTPGHLVPASEYQREALGIELLHHRGSKRMLCRLERVTRAKNIAAVGKVCALVHRHVAQSTTDRAGTFGRTNATVIARNPGIAREAQQHRRRRRGA